MKLPASIATKPTTRLFKGCYPYKVVLWTSFSHYFRKSLFDQFDRYIEQYPVHRSFYSLPNISEETQKQLAIELYKILKENNNYDIRVESPRLSIYTADESLLTKIINLNHNIVHYVSIPSEDVNLMPGEIVLKNVPYGFRVTIGSINKPYTDFLAWAEDNDNVRISDTVLRKLKKGVAWNTQYFYVKDKKNLLLVQMFFGNVITNVEKIIN